MVEGDREAFARRRRDDHVICNAEFGEIGPCAKGIVLARPDKHAEDIARTEPGRKGLELMESGVSEDVHRPYRCVEVKMYEAIVLILEQAMFHGGWWIGNLLSFGQGAGVIWSLRTLLSSVRTGWLPGSWP